MKRISKRSGTANRLRSILMVHGSVLAPAMMACALTSAGAVWAQCEHPLFEGLVRYDAGHLSLFMALADLNGDGDPAITGRRSVLIPLYPP